MNNHSEKEQDINKTRKKIYVSCSLVSLIGFVVGGIMVKQTWFWFLGCLLFLISCLVSGYFSGVWSKNSKIENAKNTYLAKFLLFLVWTIIGGLVYEKFFEIYRNYGEVGRAYSLCFLAMVFPVLWLMFDLTNAPETVSSEQQAVQNDENNK